MKQSCADYLLTEHLQGPSYRFPPAPQTGSMASLKYQTCDRAQIRHFFMSHTYLHKTLYLHVAPKSQRMGSFRRISPLNLLILLYFHVAFSHKGANPAQQRQTHSESRPDYLSSPLRSPSNLRPLCSPVMSFRVRAAVSSACGGRVGISEQVTRHLQNSHLCRG